MEKKQKISHVILPHQKAFIRLVCRRVNYLAEREEEEEEKESKKWFTFAAEYGFPATVGELFKGMSLYDRSDFIWESHMPDGEMEIVHVLLQNGALVDRCHHITGSTPLMSACQRGHRALAKLLLEWGANYDALHSDGSTPWTFVVRTNELGLADYMLDKGANPNEAVGGTSVLWLACFSKNYDMAKKLIKRGADVRIIVNGVSILHMVCQGERFDIAKYLIDRNYKLEFVDSPYFRVPLLTACLSDKPEAAQVVEEMIMRGVPINSARELMMNTSVAGAGPVRSVVTPVHLAIQANNFKMVWTLVSLGGYAVLSVPCAKGDKVVSAWHLCKHHAALEEALYNRWNPFTHHLFPKAVKDAIISLLLINKKNQLYIPTNILHHIFSFIAYGWLPLSHPAMQSLDDKITTINCQGSIKGFPGAIQNQSHFTIVT